MKLLKPICCTASKGQEWDHMSVFFLGNISASQKVQGGIINPGGKTLEKKEHPCSFIRL